MLQAFVHDAVVVVQPDGDVRAPGGAVTVALCGHWNHEPPCPLAPHHTSVERDGHGDEVRLRVLFAAEPHAEADVRDRIETTLSSAGLGAGFEGPDGVRTRWRLLAARPSPLRDDEAGHAAKLARA